MVTNTWSVVNMEVVPQEASVSDVVANVAWKLVGADGEYTSEVAGTVSLNPYQPGQPFTPYEDLTQEQVLGWVFTALGNYVGSYEALVAYKIAEQQKPPVEPRPLPWGGS